MDSDSAYIRFALRVLGELSGIILVPALLALLGARWLQASGASRNAAFGLIAAAFLLTAVLLVVRIRFYGRAFDRLTRKKPPAPPV